MHYKKVGHGPLYLEKAPLNCFTEEFKKPPPVVDEDQTEDERDQANDDENKRKRDNESDEEVTGMLYNVDRYQQRLLSDNVTKYIYLGFRNKTI